MKKWNVIYLISMLCFTLTACGHIKTSVHSNTSEPKTPSGPPTTAVSPVEPTAAVICDDSDEYILSYPIAVETNRPLILKLNGKKLSEEYEQYGINKIQVLDGEELIQTILIEEAIVAFWGDDAGFSGYTEWWDKGSGLSIADINFDGSEDIGLVGWITAGANIPSYYWLWDAGTETFQYAFCICNLEVDKENERLISLTSGGNILEQADYYEYDSEGNLQNVKRIVTEIGHVGEEVTFMTKVYELVEGELQIIA